MKRLMLILSSLIMICVITLTTPAQDDQSELTTIEEKEITKFVHKFLLRLEETRDFEPLMSEYFISNTPAGTFWPEVINDEDSNPKEIVCGLNYLHIDKLVFEQISQPLRKRFQIAALNAHYLSFYGPTYALDDEAEEKEFHKELKKFEEKVENLTIMSSLGNNNIETLTDFENYTNVLEHYNRFQREYYSKHPEKCQKTYQKNFKNNGDLLKVINKPMTEEIAEDNGDQVVQSLYKAIGLPISRFYKVQLNCEMMICLIREKDALKIVSLYYIGD